MESTAYHEASHAVLSYFLMPKTKIEQVTVAPRSEALGFVSYDNEEYIDTSSKAELFNNVCVLLAGRMATLHKYGAEGLETGAVSDLEIASMQVYAAIAIFGMDEKLANISVSGIEVGYNKELFTKKIEERMLVWLDEAETKTKAEVEKHWKAIEAVAKVLIKKEVIDGEELKDIIQKSTKTKKSKKES
jgi:ATP-dependent Zn protease